MDTATATAAAPVTNNGSNGDTKIVDASPVWTISQTDPNIGLKSSALRESSFGIFKAQVVHAVELVVKEHNTKSPLSKAKPDLGLRTNDILLDMFEQLTSFLNSAMVLSTSLTMPNPNNIRLLAHGGLRGDVFKTCVARQMHVAAIKNAVKDAKKKTAAQQTLGGSGEDVDMLGEDAPAAARQERKGSGGTSSGGKRKRPQASPVEEADL